MAKQVYKVEDVQRVIRFGKVFDHATRVELLMQYMERGPCSAAMLARDGFRGLGLQDIDYHQKCLLAVGAVENVESRQVRGGREQFYNLTAFGIEILRTAVVVGRKR